MMPRPSLRLACTLAASLIAAAEAAAQRPLSRVLGTVVDKASQVPVRQANVVSLTDGRIVLSDSAGAFLMDSLPMGLAKFVIRAPGYHPQTLLVALAHNDTVERLVELDIVAAADPATGKADGKADGQPLAPVRVEARQPMNPRMADFERRRHTGLGQYLARDEIERSGVPNVQDAIGRMRGITTDCSGEHCRIRMTRAPMTCLPDWYIDGYKDNFFGPMTPIRDIAGIEVYTGASDVPGEFAGKNAGCGTVVIWTRSGPKGKGSG